MAMNHSPGFLALVTSVRKRIRETTIPEVAARLRQNDPTLKLVDVREESEWASGHLPGALHLGKGIIERDIETTIPNRATQLVLYCGGGYRSALAVDALQQMGYTNVLSMDGGYRGWTEAKLPIEKAR